MKRNSYYKAILKLTDNYKQAADIVFKWYQNEQAFEDFDDSHKERLQNFEEFIRSDIYELLDAAGDPREASIVRWAVGEADATKASIDQLRPSNKSKYFQAIKRIVNYEECAAVIVWRWYYWYFEERPFAEVAKNPDETSFANVAQFEQFVREDIKEGMLFGGDPDPEEAIIVMRALGYEDSEIPWLSDDE